MWRTRCLTRLPCLAYRPRRLRLGRVPGLWPQGTLPGFFSRADFWRMRHADVARSPAPVFAFRLQDGEAAALKNGFSDSTSVLSSGIHFNGVKYMTIRADSRSIYGKKGATGVIAVITKQVCLARMGSRLPRSRARSLHSLTLARFTPPGYHRRLPRRQHPAGPVHAYR